MKTIEKIAALATVAVMVPTIALASVSVGDLLGTTEMDVRSNLETAGYVVDEIELEDGELEAYATLDGVLYEIAVAADTGAILEIELEDEDDYAEDEDDDMDEADDSEVAAKSTY